MSLNIVNIKSRKPFDLYIGRANVYYNQAESIFHNPFVIGKDGTRAEVIEKFREYALKTPDILSKLYLIDDSVLGCWCDYPAEDCHGRVLFELRQEQLKNL
jgi:hypothetical protein